MEKGTVSRNALVFFPVSAHLMGVVLEISFTEGGRKKVVPWISARRTFQA